MSDVTMPQLGETVTEGTITKWFKKVGDRVERDELLFEVSTDKVDSEVTSPAAGVLAEIKVAEGDTVDVGSVLAVISDGAATPVAEAPAPVPAQAAVEVPPAPVAPPAPAPVTVAPVVAATARAFSGSREVTLTVWPALTNAVASERLTLANPNGNVSMPFGGPAAALLSASIRSYDVKCGTFHSVPARFARSGSVSHTATSSRPSILSIASKWFLLMRPHPSSAMRNVLSGLT